MNTPQFYSKIVYKQVNRMKRVKKGTRERGKTEESRRTAGKIRACRNAAESATNM